MPPLSSTELPLIAAKDGVRLSVRLTPRGAADRIDSIAREADGIPVLKVSVTAAPAENRANDALLHLLAREWRLGKRDLSLVSGSKSRNKTVHIAGDPAVLLARLEPLLAVLPRR